MKVVAIVQARMSSTRLPGKVMKEVNGIPLIELLLSRLSKSKLLDSIVVAASEGPENKKLVKHVRQLGFECEQGSENDVLSRFYYVAKQRKADVIVRITGDCPLVDPTLVDEVIKQFFSCNVDYFCNGMPPSYPDGLDVEVFSWETLESTYLATNSMFDREHVTPQMQNSDPTPRGTL